MTKEELEQQRAEYERKSGGDKPGAEPEQSSSDKGDGDTPSAAEPAESPSSPSSGSAPDMSHRAATILFLALSAVGLRVASSGKLARAWSALWGSTGAGIKK